MRGVQLSELIEPAGHKAGHDISYPVYSVTKHAGFVMSTEYFKKQVYSRELSRYKLVRAGDFAYATIHLDEGSIGIAPGDGLISPMYTAFRANTTRVDPNYLLRYLKSPIALAQYPRLGKGSVHRRRSISLEALGTLPIPLPHIEDQRRIAAILDHADALRAKRRQVLAHLNGLEQSIFNDMFGDIPAAETVEAIAADEKGSIRTGPFGSQLLHSEFVEDGIAVLGLDNVVGNEFRWAGRRFITSEKYLQLSRYTVYPDDVLISIMGTTGRCVVVPTDIPKSINTKHICAITPDRDRIDPVFLRATFLWHPDARLHLRRQTKGSIMNGLNMTIIKSMPVPVPPLTHQEVFAARVAETAAQRAAMQRALATDDELFASLQSRAFEGEL